MIALKIIHVTACESRNRKNCKMFWEYILRIE